MKTRTAIKLHGKKKS